MSISPTHSGDKSPSPRSSPPGRTPTRTRALPIALQRRRELGTAVDAQLAIGALEVVLDGAYRDEDLIGARQSGGSAGTTVGRANIDGTGAPNNLFVTGATFSIGVATPSGIAVDGTYVYWANQPTSGVYGSIGRALDGGAATQSFVSNVFYPVGLDVDPPAASPPGPGPGPTTPGPSTPGPGPVPIGVDPPSPDLVAASTPSCLSIPSVVRNQKLNVRAGRCSW